MWILMRGNVWCSARVKLKGWFILIKMQDSSSSVSWLKGWWQSCTFFYHLENHMGDWVLMVLRCVWKFLVRNLIFRVHLHKFRRTLATNAINKGMPIDQLQKLLGHVQIDTTMQYAMVNQSNVKISHRKFIT